MTIREIAARCEGRVISGERNLDMIMEHAFASDLMSDVLTTDVANLVLVTGLSNLQTIRTAEMADIFGVLLVRGKKATKEMVLLAEEQGIVVIETPWSMFRVCGTLFGSGLKPLF
jgi:predicted transcriptional regulator